MTDSTNEFIQETSNSERIRLAIILLVVAMLILLAVIISQTILEEKINQFSAYTTTIDFITDEIAQVTSLGLLFVGLLGGLFFIPLPIELIFIRGLVGGNNPIFAVSLVMVGWTISNLLDYFLGAKFSNVVMHFVSKKQLYKIRRKVNKYGWIALVGFNLLPLPAPLLSLALGIARYNMMRFFVFFFTASLTKFTVISVVYGLIA